MADDEIFQVGFSMSLTDWDRFPDEQQMWWIHILQSTFIYEVGSSEGTQHIVCVERCNKFLYLVQFAQMCKATTPRNRRTWSLFPWQLFLCCCTHTVSRHKSSILFLISRYTCGTDMCLYWHCPTLYHTRNRIPMCPCTHTRSKASDRQRLGAWYIPGRYNVEFWIWRVLPWASIPFDSIEDLEYCENITVNIVKLIKVSL